MSTIALPALRGRNPLGLFAALGAFDVATRRLPERRVTLRWTDTVEPTTLLEGPDSLDHLVELCDQDRHRWAASPLLTWGPGGGEPARDLKVHLDDLDQWTRLIVDTAIETRERTDVDLFAALVAQGAKAGKGDSKPTHFHFTAGRQLFLDMVRELQREVDAERLHEALAGPWRYDSSLPVLGWDTRGERIYALRGPNPAKDQKLGVPGADWLGFLGLRFFPVAVRQNGSGEGQLVTTGCSPGWKSGTFTWPLWHVGLTAEVVLALMGDPGLVEMPASDRALLGIHQLLRAPIRRHDQGGYGSFGAPEPVAPAGRKQSTRAR